MDAPRMKMDKNNVTQIILNLTLDTIYLLTGENYEVMKRTSGSGGVLSRVPGGPNSSCSLTTNPSPTSMKKEKKILELTNEVIHILTGEVWKYLGQTTLCDYTKLEDSLSLRTNGDTTHDDPPKCGEKNSNFQDMSIATDSTHHISLKPNVSEEVPLPDPNILTPTLIKEEPMPAVEHLPNLEVSKPRQRILQVDKFSLEDRNPQNLEFNSPEDDAQFISFVIKEEDEDVPDSDLNTSTNHVQITSPGILDESTIVENLDKNLTSLGNKFGASPNHEPHHQVNFGEDPYSCYDPGAGVGVDFATAGFSRTGEKPTDPQTNLGKHLMIIRKGKTFFCSECGKSSSWRSVLVLHQRIHTGEKPFSCLECGKCFNCKSHLILHQRTHTGEKPYSCTECGKRFTCSSHLATHRRVHTGEKPYSCSECSKSFISNSNLIRHQKFHTGDKPYSCPDCGKCYRYNSDLARHQRRKPGSKAYSCSECGMCYFSKCALAVHLQTHGLAPQVL